MTKENEEESKPSLGRLSSGSNKQAVEENKSQPKAFKEENLFENIEKNRPKYRQNKGFVEIEANSQTPGVDSEFTPIAALNPMNPDWIIKARVTKKGAPRHWKSFRGEGDLMNIELKDEYGTAIQGTFFNKHIEVFQDQIMEGKVYSFRHGSIKAANPKYSSIKHQYWISFNSHTRIIPLEDDGLIAEDCYSYSNLMEISSLEGGKIVDTKGVVLEVEEMDEITMKNGMAKPIRRIIIADHSTIKGVSMQVTFWGKIAYKTNFNKGEIIALKDAKVGKYNGVSLNMSDEWETKKLKDEKELREWFSSLRGTNEITRLSEQNK